MTVQEWLGEDNEIGIDIWKRKYQYNDESFDEWLDRVSGDNSAIRNRIVKKQFLFGGRILANRGLENKGRKITLSNCYVMNPVEDNIESIFNCARDLARTYSYGGGCGVDISKLAPHGAAVRNAAKETSGAVSFMDLFSLVTELIGQNGRRGALMISMDVHHPDIEEFIDIKTDLSKVTKANISIKVDAEFMDAVKNDTDYELRFYREETNQYITKTVNARKLFHHIAEVNWDYGEPGMLFWDRVNLWNMLSNRIDFQYAGVNPCGEETLPAGGSCLLGSINLSAFVYDGTFHFDELDECVYTAVDALNEVLDEGCNLHPLQYQQESVRNWRQIGLGIMGLADCLVKLNYRYGSDESLNFCDKLGFRITFDAIQESCKLAKQYGPYPKYNHLMLITEFFEAAIPTTTQLYKDVMEYGLRNSQILTIAPTGTISTMLGISGGIEPIFANSYTRKTESLFGEDKYYKVYTPIVKKYMELHQLTDESDLPSWFVTSKDIPIEDRINMQAVWQKHIDASISSTINLPHTATVEDIENVYMLAYDKGLKGVTVFRDKCKRVGILSNDQNTTSGVESHEGPISLARGEVIKVNDHVIGKKRKLMTGCGTLHCVALFDPDSGQLLETYLSKGSTGGCNNFMIGLSRMISIAARGGISIEDIVDQLNSTGSCPSYAVRRATHKDTSRGSCCPMAVGNALIDMYKEVQLDLKKLHSDRIMDDYIKSSQKLIENKIVEHLEYKIKDSKCPECGEPLSFEGGCNICRNCGWSRCS